MDGKEVPKAEIGHRMKGRPVREGQGDQNLEMLRTGRL